MTVWEYHEEAVPLGQQKAVIDKAGRDGWELCGMAAAEVTESPPFGWENSRLVPVARPKQGPGFLLYFKRPLAEGARPANAAEHEGIALPG